MTPSKKRQVEEIREFSQCIFEEEAGLIEKIAEIIPVEDNSFFEFRDKTADEISSFCGFFDTATKEKYALSWEEAFGYNADKYKSTFALEINHRINLKNLPGNFPR